MTGAGASAILAETTVNGGSILACVGDLTRQDVDVVVNAANEHLRHGGGVAAALARGGGPDVQQASDAHVAAHGPVRPGTAAVTTAGALPARHIVHVVGPRYRAGQDNAALLAEAVVAALDAAESIGAASIALPAISAGIFGYPPEEASAVIVRTTCEWLAAGSRGIDEVRLVGLDETSARRFAAALPGETTPDAGSGVRGGP